MGRSGPSIRETLDWQRKNMNEFFAIVFVLSLYSLKTITGMEGSALKVQTESGLRIDGLRVLYKFELFPHDALLGCAVEVPTLDGIVTLQVPPKSSTGRLLRLKGRGLTYGDNVGDQYVEILVVIPDDINEEEIALYTRLQELSLSDS